jgi:hypothetical protein
MRLAVQPPDKAQEYRRFAANALAQATVEPRPSPQCAWERKPCGVVPNGHSSAVSVRGSVVRFLRTPRRRRWGFTIM